MQRVQAIEMRKRRRAQHTARGAQAMLRGAEAPIAQDRAIRMQHALRCGRGAGGIEKQERVFWARPRAGIQGTGILDFRKRDRAPLEHLLRLRHADGEARPAVAHERLDLGATVRHVQRAHHRAQARDRKIAQDELGDVRQLHRHDIAGGNPAPPQTGCSPEYPVFELAPTEHAGLKRHSGRFGSLAHMARQPLRQRVVRPPAARGEFRFHLAVILIAWTKPCSWPARSSA